MWSKHRRKVPISSIGKGGKTREGNRALIVLRPRTDLCIQKYFVVVVMEFPLKDRVKLDWINEQ
jgi:hypothetical protein